MTNNLLSIELISAEMISPKVKHFVFKIDEGHDFSYTPGQFITLHFEHDGRSLKRSYSLAQSPSHEGTIEIAAGYVEEGPGTTLLFNLSPGQKIQMSGPYGRLILKETSPKRYIFIGTSTGVTPYRAMLSQLSERLKLNPALSIVFLQGVQHHDDVLYAEDFLQFSESYPQAKFLVQLSRGDLDPLAPYESKGYVQSAFSGLSLNPLEDEIYLCGNPSMIDDAFDLLKNQGFQPPQIIREKYISR